MNTIPKDRERKLIANADDFGLTPHINREIIRCINDGILTSVSLIPNGYASDEAISIARSWGNKIGLGVHLTLDSSTPVLPFHLVSSLVTKNGIFCNRVNTLLRLLTNRISIKQVYLEWDAQIRKIIDSGLEVDHIDSHGHLHIFPSLANVAVELAQKYNISAVRLPLDRITRGKSYRRIPGRLALSLAALLAKQKFKGKLQHPDYMLGFSTSGCYQEKHFLEDIHFINPGETVEAMFHPGPKNIDKEEFNAWGYKWDIDAKTLCSNRVKEYIKERGIELITFKELKNSCQFVTV